MQKHITLFVAVLIHIGANAQTRADLQKSVSDFQKSHPSYGLSIGIVKADSTYYFQMGTGVTQETVFEIGSLTKTFTGLLLGIAVERKKIPADASIDKYLPVNVKLRPSLKNRVKMTDLASHQSGLPNFNDDQYIMELFKNDPEQPFRSVDSKYLYHVISNTDTLHNYGTYQYNNFAYGLLGQLLSNQAGVQY